MQVVLGCEPNGFGPVSKLTAIARLLPGMERIFVGDAGAYEFARRNPDCFEQFYTVEEFHRRPDLMAASDFAMVVMEPDITFELLQLGVPVHLFDSLIEFWILPRGIAPLADAARLILDGGPQARAVFQSFTIHERKLLAHMIATRSFAQNFPGVPERLEALRQHGFGNTSLLGSIIDLPKPRPGAENPSKDDTWSMLINLGGVQNFAIRFHDNDYAIDLIERWAEAFLRDMPQCRQITICCGRYTAADSRAVGDGLLTRRFASRNEFIGLLGEADVVLSAAGRTTLHEAVHLRKPLILLPEQHHNQYCNLMSLKGIRLGRMAVALEDVIDIGRLSHDDFEGTLQIIEATRRLLADEQAFARFDRLLRERVVSFLAMSAADRLAAVDEAAACLAGSDFAATVQSVGQAQVRARGGPGVNLELVDG
jgi:UDP-N-acetylglucosamine transferase subunit ALG13